MTSNNSRRGYAYVNLYGSLYERAAQLPVLRLGAEYGGLSRPLPVYCRKYRGPQSVTDQEERTERETKNMSWHRQARCEGEDPDLFDVTGRTTDAPLRVYVMCRDCTVRRECAADALEPLAVGTIRAGVAIPDAWRKTAGARAALTRVVRGDSA